MPTTYIGVFFVPISFASCTGVGPLLCCPSDSTTMATRSSSFTASNRVRMLLFKSVLPNFGVKFSAVEIACSDSGHHNISLLFAPKLCTSR
jgi:hypothetical protein